MSRKGGYQIIDLKGVDLSNSVKIEGITFNLIKTYIKLSKPLLLANIKSTSSAPIINTTYVCQIMHNDNDKITLMWGDGNYLNILSDDTIYLK